MKAVIMAGGKGQRLRPLTDTLPKPLLPIGGTSALQRILALLHRHGITEAAVTVGYLAEKIEEAIGKECEGVKITYFREEAPLGTAGSIKAAEGFLDGEDFLVISGDAVCEIDLSAAIASRRSRDALALLVLSRVSDPGEYGVVLCDEQGRIRGFSEKPSLSATYTDTVNTGIYLFSRRIFDFLPEGVSDFGRDIFPSLLQNGEALYGLVDSAYWCDIGDPDTYYRANMRASGGKNVIGENCRLDSDAISASVLLADCSVGRGSRIDKAVLCRHVTIGEDCVIGEGCILGEGCTVGDGAVIADGTVLNTGSQIPEGAFWRQTSGIPKERLPSLLDGRGLACLTEEMTPSLAMRVGYALALTFDHGRIGLMHDGNTESSRISAALLRGIRMAGNETVLLEQGFEAAAAYAATVMSLSMALFVREEKGRLSIALFDRNGLYPKRDDERRFLSHLRKDPVDSDRPPHRPISCHFLEEIYLPMLTDYRCSLDGLPVTVSRENEASRLLERALLALGASVGKDGLRLSVSNDGFSLAAEQNGFTTDDWHIKALLLRYLIRDRVSLPIHTPAAVCDLCYGHCDLYTHCPGDDREEPIRKKAREHPELTHACVAGIALSALLAASHRDLRSLTARLPSFAVARHELLTDHAHRLSVLTLLGSPAGDGILASYSHGSVRIVPTPRGYRLFSEAVSGEYASELLSLSEKEIRRLLKEHS